MNSGENPPEDADSGARRDAHSGGKRAGPLRERRKKEKDIMGFRKEAPGRYLRMCLSKWVRYRRSEDVGEGEEGAEGGKGEEGKGGGEGEDAPNFGS